MKLGEHVEMVLGTVLTNHDPLKIGRCKIGAPGYFDRTVMGIKSIPWVYPLTMGFNQSYSTPSDGSKVWLIDNKDNTDEFWYIPFHELNDETRDALGDNIDSDVVFARNINGKLTRLFQNSEKGIYAHVNDASIQITPLEKIILKNGDASIVMNDKTVYCGATGGEGDSQPMVMGRTCSDILKQIAADFGELSRASGESWTTAALIEPFMTAQKHILDKIEELLSQHCTLSK